eukprot:TRINITY_DN8902_c0_g1_i14.p1 TRINITY_DN8902_c0_g1~~TRINITY_DN8902_c0_g1_i14.p1  ORF type:complete len:264 (+),score=50.64 TRINITY_DN8902_c0_g1_i14:138-929(+)
MAFVTEVAGLTAWTPGGSSSVAASRQLVPLRRAAKRKVVLPASEELLGQLREEVLALGGSKKDAELELFRLPLPPLRPVKDYAAERLPPVPLDFSVEANQTGCDAEQHCSLEKGLHYLDVQRLSPRSDIMQAAASPAQQLAMLQRSASQPAVAPGMLRRDVHTRLQRSLSWARVGDNAGSPTGPKAPPSLPDVPSAGAYWQTAAASQPAPLPADPKPVEEPLRGAANHSRRKPVTLMPFQGSKAPEFSRCSVPVWRRQRLPGR